MRKVNVGDMPIQSAQEYMEAIMEKFKNRIVYDGKLNEAKRETMIEEFTTLRKEDERT